METSQKRKASHTIALSVDYLYFSSQLNYEFSYWLDHKCNIFIRLQVEFNFQFIISNWKLFILLKPQFLHLSSEVTTACGLL